MPGCLFVERFHQEVDVPRTKYAAHWVYLRKIFM